MKHIFIKIIKTYQRFLSPDQGYIRLIFPTQRRCGMYPSCSEYAILVIERHGAIYGLIRVFGRILRCHPFQKKLIDIP